MPVKDLGCGSAGSRTSGNFRALNNSHFACTLEKNQTASALLHIQIKQIILNLLQHPNFFICLRIRLMKKGVDLNDAFDFSLFNQVKKIK
jgi:hypothetical protein